MSAISATVGGAELVSGVENSVINGTTGLRKTYRIMAVLGTQTAGDTATIPTGDTKLQNILKNGKTVTLRAAAAGGAGLTPGGTAAYALAATISSSAINFSVGGPTAAAAVAAGTEVPVFITVDES